MVYTAWMQTHVSKESHIVRYRTTEAFLASGTPMDRLPFFRDLIERGSAAITSRSHLANTYIPKIESEQVSLLKDEFANEWFSLQFDGTTRIGEAIVCVGRFCSSEFELTTRLLMIKTSLKHVKGKQLAAIITQLVCNTLGLDPMKCVCVTRDSASVNGNACKRLSQNPFVDTEQMMCICHTLNNCGGHLSLPALDSWMTPWLELVGGRNPHSGAMSLWKDTVAPTVVPGFSNVRWYSKAEISFVLAEHFDKIGDFLDEIDELGYGEATRKSLRQIFTNDHAKLELQLAGMLDMRTLVKTTYELEGDRLEVLLVYRRIEALRKLGQSIKNYEDGCLPNVQALLRSRMELKAGVQITKDFPPHGSFDGSIISSSRVNSTLYPGKEVVAFNVRYPADGTREDLEEDEVRPLLQTAHLREFQETCDALVGVFDYLEHRMTGVCNDIYDCEDMYETCRLFQAFDPSFAANLTNEWIDNLFKISMFGGLEEKRKLKTDLPKYKALSAEWNVDHSSVDTFTENVLKFWKRARKDIPSWSQAARKAFACSPNSAASERVFSLLATLFGHEQMSTLADMIQASLMLRYNKRVSCVSGV